MGWFWVGGWVSGWVGFGTYSMVREKSFSGGVHCCFFFLAAFVVWCGWGEWVGGWVDVFISIRFTSPSHPEYVSLGFSIGKPGAFVYISDVKKIPQESLVYLKGLPAIDVLVLDCISVQKDVHYSHFNLAEALATVDDLKPRQCFLTGMSCDVGPHDEMNEKLREMGYAHVALSYDGMVVRGVEM